MISAPYNPKYRCTDAARHFAEPLYTFTQCNHEFTAIYERDDEWLIAYCPEVPGANGQGRTKDEARKSLTEAIALILEVRRDEGLRGVPADAERETISVDVRAA